VFTDGLMDKFDELKNTKDEDIRNIFKLIHEKKVRLSLVDTSGM